MTTVHPLAWIFRSLASAMRRSPAQPTSPPRPQPPEHRPGPPPAAAQSFRDAQGSAEGWLRVLDADTLIKLVQGDQALRKMWTQSRLSAQVWERDLLQGVRRYAELVQLMPASQAHHHAHVGGLLAHTLEMVLAALTWRNGHLLPEGASVEHMDAQRDEWTYVVFYAALLHDVAKVLSDLHVTWRARGIGDPVRWSPISGTLAQVIAPLSGGEYHVSFAPKSQRDYQAHSKLAVVLLQSVAPPAAMSFLARNPSALEALANYLSGGDKTSLIAKIVLRADQASTQRALLQGSRERFVTANSTPLIDLLMGAVRALLGAGTLPLNRSGAAGWVFDDSVWFVAKRLADSVRAHLKQTAPDEAVPGEAKNDRLFDTWQDYGCISLNPSTGQAIWHVTIVGEMAQGDAPQLYQHDLAVLRFPLAKLYDTPQQFPAPMSGRVEVRAGRPGKATADPQEPSTTQEAAPAADQHAPTQPSHRAAEPTQASLSPAATVAVPAPLKPTLRAPAFNKPREPKPAPDQPRSSTSAGTAKRPETAPGSGDATEGPVVVGGADNFDADDDWLEPVGEIVSHPPRQVSQPAAQGLRMASVSPAPSATAPRATPGATAAARSEPSGRVSPATAKKKSPGPAEQPAPGSASSPQATSTVAVPAPAVSMPLVPLMPHVAQLPPMPSLQSLPLLAQGRPISTRAAIPPPVVLTPYLPDLPHEATAEPANETALAFMGWLQSGLAERRLKYNETAALVHFVPEGMALVSPLIFKTYAQDAHPDDAAQGLQVQRAVLKAGWHLMGPGKINILSYHVMGRGGIPVSRLSAVVLTDPARWVTPVPPANPVLSLAPAREESCTRL